MNIFLYETCRAHLVTWRGSKVLLLCGSSHLEVEGGQGALHPAAATVQKHLANPYLALLQVIIKPTKSA